MRVADLGEAQLRNDQYAEETERAQRVVAEKESATLRWALDVLQKVPKDQGSYWQYEMDGSWRALPPYLPYLHYVPASRLHYHHFWTISSYSAFRSDAPMRCIHCLTCPQSGLTNKGPATTAKQRLGGFLCGSDWMGTLYQAMSKTRLHSVRACAQQWFGRSVAFELIGRGIAS